MAAVLRPQPQNPEQRRLRALEEMIRTLCERIGWLAERDRADASREAELQRAVFAERRDRALSYVASERGEPASIRIGNLEKLVEALECSRAYYGAALGEAERLHVLRTQSGYAR